MMRTRSGRVIRISRLARVSTLILLGGFAAGCSDPDHAILDRLNETEKERFLSGRSVAAPCWICHDLAGTVKKVGPPLLGVYGRNSGLAPEYGGSPAMIGATIIWDDRSLAAFLMDPAGFVPGNRMVSPGVQNRAALSDLLFYLKHVTRPGARTAEGSGEPSRTDG
jgi:cytochrome c